ncbi:MULTISPECIES: PaaI family thioesterase [unclassified Halanaerobium]|uniref:PaaI family thioesterase n=1 Tax=unclassified Halanaerobium TaxID=2641197 RepID=UPI001F409A3E|nr:MULTISPECIES: PaaI family thioesterase [unclassified Halanaerobium]
MEVKYYIIVFGKVVKLMPQREDKMCFACGEENPISLGLKFKKIDKNTVEAEFVPGKLYQGYDGIMHGGLVSTLLDEAMAYAVGARGVSAFTAEIKVRFKKAVKIGEKIKITGFYRDCYSKSIGTIHFTEAEIKDEAGKVKAKAEAKFMEEKEI